MQFNMPATLEIQGTYSHSTGRTDGNETARQLGKQFLKQINLPETWAPPLIYPTVWTTKSHHTQLMSPTPPSPPTANSCFTQTPRGKAEVVPHYLKQKADFCQQGVNIHNYLLQRGRFLP